MLGQVLEEKKKDNTSSACSMIVNRVRLQPYTIGIGRTAYIYGYGNLVYIYHIYTVIRLGYTVVASGLGCTVLFHLRDGQVNLKQAAPYPQGQVRSTETVVALEKTFDDKVHPIRTTPEIGEAPITVADIPNKISIRRLKTSQSNRTPVL